MKTNRNLFVCFAACAVLLSGMLVASAGERDKRDRDLDDSGSDTFSDSATPSTNHPDNSNQGNHGNGKGKGGGIIALDNAGSTNLELTSMTMVINSRSGLLGGPTELSTVTIVVTNTSTVDAPAFRLDTSFNAALALTCGATGSISKNFDGLAAGASITEVYTFTLPNPGIYNVVTFVDSQCAIQEAKESDNKAALTYTVSKSDLAVTSVSVTTATGDLTPGAAATLTVTIENPTSIDFWTAFQLDAWFNRNAQPTCDLAGSVTTNLASLTRNTSLTFNYPFTIPSAGSKRAWAFVESTCDTTELTENNNKGSLNFTVSQSDLLITGMTVTPTVGTPGAAGTLSVTIKNVGSVTAIGTNSSAFRLDSWFERASSPPFGTDGSVTSSFSSLAAGASVTTNYSFTFGSATGTFVSHSIVDSGSVVTEANEGNNRGSVSYTLTDVTTVTASGATLVAGVGSISIIHFVTPKVGGNVTLTAKISPDTAAARDTVTWEGATQDATNKLVATVSKAASAKNVVKVKINGDVRKELRVWVVWSTTTSITHAISTGATSITTGDGTTGAGIFISGGYDYTFTVTPAEIITDADRPDLTGANTSAVPGSTLTHVISGNTLAGGADKKWDCSRQIRIKILNPNLYPTDLLPRVSGHLWTGQPVATATPESYPSDPALGNDDTTTTDPENNDPYTNGGKIDAHDEPTTTMRNSTGANGDTFERRYHFIEFLRLNLGSQWLRISDDYPWRVHFKYKRVGGVWTDDGSDEAQDNAGF